MTKLFVAILEVPSFIALSRRAARRVRLAEKAALSMNGEIGDGALLAFLSQARYRKRAPAVHLSHRLAGHFIKNRTDADRTQVHINDLSSDESVVAKQTYNRLVCALDSCDFSLFCEHLENVNALCRSIPSSRIRIGTVTSTKDRAGIYWEFPAQDDVMNMLSCLFKSLLRTERPALISACVAYCVIASAHPFSDGNGRTARILLNQVFWICFDRQLPYIPFKEISKTFDSTHVLFLRELRATQRWEPICLYLSSIIILYSIYLRDRMRCRVALSSQS